MAFQKFKAGNYGRNLMERTAIQIRAGAYLSLTSAAREAIGAPTHIVLYYDADTKLMGIRAAKAGEEDAVVLSDHGLRVNAKRFLRQTDVTCKEYERIAYSAKYDEDEGMLIIDLGRPPFLREEIEHHAPRPKKTPVAKGRPGRKSAIETTEEVHA